MAGISFATGRCATVIVRASRSTATTMPSTENVFAANNSGTRKSTRLDYNSTVKFALVLLPAFAFAADVQWPVNGGVDNIRYSPLKQITPVNASQLQLAWHYDTNDEF